MLATFVTLKVKAGSESSFEAVANELAMLVREKEPGCVLYQLCKSALPQTYHFIERYKDLDALQEHRKTEHFRTLGARMAPLMDGKPEAIHMTEI